MITKKIKKKNKTNMRDKIKILNGWGYVIKILKLNSPPFKF